MREFCGECALLDRKDCKWDDRYYCKKTGKRYKLDDSACKYIVKKDQDKKGYTRIGWYITTAICNILGYEDDCEVFTLTSQLRENHFAQTEEGLAFLNEYDFIGPMIADKLYEENNVEFATSLLERFLIPCAVAIKTGNYEEAAAIYLNMIIMLKAKYGIYAINYNYGLDIMPEEHGRSRELTPRYQESE